MELFCLQLKEKARSIYNTYLSENAPYSVNIDDTAKTEEKDLKEPTPDMFNKAQTQVCLEPTFPIQQKKVTHSWCLGLLCVSLSIQIFKLMKMDSYRRFVRSPLYQSCTLASVEGKLLPQLSIEPARMGSLEDMATRSPSLSDRKVEWQEENIRKNNRELVYKPFFSLMWNLTFL